MWSVKFDGTNPILYNNGLNGRCSHRYRFTLINNSGYTFFPLFFVRVCGQITCNKMGWYTVHKNMWRNAEFNNEIQRTITGVTAQLQYEGYYIHNGRAGAEMEEVTNNA